MRGRGGESPPRVSSPLTPCHMTQKHDHFHELKMEKNGQIFVLLMSEEGHQWMKWL